MTEPAVRRVPLAALVEDDRNARVHDERNLEAIRSSIRKHGQVEPLVVHAATMRVIGGNARLRVLREEGATDALCVVYDGTEAAARDLAVRLNRTAELAGWDEVVLEGLLRELADSGEAAMADLGFSDVDLAALREPPASEQDGRPKRFVAGGDDGPPDEFPGAERVANVSCPKCGFSWHGTGGGS